MLYIVATPIGNLSDISQRAIAVLRSVDCILAEDTRHTQKLLVNYQINCPLQSLHDHNEYKKTTTIIAQLKQGRTFALVSDAGTPLISDPGFILVSQAQKANIKVVPIPGANAAITALSASGIACDRWTFWGFMPLKKNQKESVLKLLLYKTETSIFYESPKRILSTLEIMQQILGSKRFVCVAKELTKQFEVIKTGTIDTVLSWLLADSQLRNGEFVLIIAPAQHQDSQQQHRQLVQIMPILLEELNPTLSAKIAAKITGLNKKTCYEHILRNHRKIAKTTV